jgi:2-dehydropantoate 2-reductase
VHNPIVGNAGFIEVGVYPGGADALAREAAAALARASYAAAANADVMAAKAAKMLGNLGNAMGAITDGRGDGRGYMERVRREATDCFVAAGVPCETREAFAARASGNRGTSQLPPGLRNLGSSWQSLQRRQGTIEADYLNGEIVRLGRINGVPTPYNEVLQGLGTLGVRLREVGDRLGALGEDAEGGVRPVLGEQRRHAALDVAAG